MSRIRRLDKIKRIDLFINNFGLKPEQKLPFIRPWLGRGYRLYVFVDYRYIQKCPERINVMADYAAIYKGLHEKAFKDRSGKKIPCLVSDPYERSMVRGCMIALPDQFEFKR